jgi:Flp pilus assembly protein TadD
MHRFGPIVVASASLLFLGGASCGGPRQPPPAAGPTPAPRARTATAPKPPPDAVGRATAQAGRGDVSGAIAVLRRHLEEKPDDHEARLRLGRFLDHEGKADEAIAVWKAGLARKGGATSGRRTLHLAMARRLRQQAEDGPNVVRRRQTVTFRPGEDAGAEKAYREARARRALAHFQAALELEPADADALAAAAGLQNALERHAAAAATWRTGVKRFPGRSTFVLGLAYSLELLGKVDEAADQYRRALGLSPRLAVAHAALAKLYARQGKAREAREAAARARFFGWLPDFVELSYDARVARTIEALSRKGREKVIERLLEERSRTASALLAALIHRHRDHGPLEDRMFAELSRRQRVDLLRALLRHGKTTCTLRGAAHALARLKDPALLDLLVRMLPGDTRGVFWIDVAGALATLGDPRAVPHLVQVLAPERRHKAPRDDFMMQSLGLLLARRRAACALGRFKADARARGALERGLKNPDLALHCRAALHRLTRGSGHLAALRKGLAREYDASIVEYVRAYAPEEARALARLAPKEN